MKPRHCLQFAAIASIAVACNGIRAAPIYDDEDLDAGTDASSAADVANDVAEASSCTTTAPATCGHDPHLPIASDADVDAATTSGPSCHVAARLLKCPSTGNATVSCPSDTGTCPSATGACTDLCCADEYVADCTTDYVAPSSCRALPPNPGGFDRQYCCKCQ